jgi:hypothetical protein
MAIATLSTTRLEGIARANDMLRALIFLPVPYVAHAEIGTRKLSKIIYSEAVERLQRNPGFYNDLLEEITYGGEIDGFMRDKGVIDMDLEHRFLWAFTYVDSTGLHPMPDGERILIVCQENEKTEWMTKRGVVFSWDALQTSLSTPRS